MSSAAGLVARIMAGLRFDGLFWRRFARLGCVYGPEWWKQGSPPVIAATIFALVGRNRRGAMSNLRRVLADDDEWRVGLAALRMFAQFAHCMTETLEYLGPRPQPIRLDLPEHDTIAGALREGHGAVLVTGHIGNWDVAAKALRDYDRPINLVMAREQNAAAAEYVRAIREQAGVRVIYSDTSVFSSLNMIRALRQNEIVAIQLDRMVGFGGGKLVPFFGRLAPFPSGPFVLARLAGAPLIPVFAPRLGTRHYAIRLGQRVSLSREARDPHSLARAMRAVVAQFEDVIREFPSQWFMFAPFWPDQLTAPALASVAESDERRARGSDER